MMMSMSGSGPTGPPPIPDDPTIYAEVPIAVADRDVTDVIVPVQTRRAAHRPARVRRQPRTTGRGSARTPANPGGAGRRHAPW
jgi:hypothetical protein